MEQFISREDICRELEIDLESLADYERYLELPSVRDNQHHISIARTISRIHELVSNGLNLSDLKYLSMCAEQFNHIVPGLRNYVQFSAKENLRELNQHLQGIVKEFSERELQYKETIVEFQNSLEQLQLANDDQLLLKRHMERSAFELEQASLVLQERDETIAEMQEQINKMEFKLDELVYQNAKKDSMIAQLETALSHGYTKSTGAVDIDTLLKKKEREIEIKHQRQMVDLKRQLERLMPNKEQEAGTQF